MVVRKLSSILIPLFCLLFFFTASAKSLYAASATITLSPPSETHAVNESFTVAVNISGGGQAFNTASATVSVSSNISVAALTPGDCNFTYITKPTTQNPSFVGATLGSSSTGCSAYTLTLQGTSAGVGQITISDPMVVSQTTNQNILSGVTNGTYNFTGSQPTITETQPTATNSPPTPTQSETQTNHTIIIKVVDKANAPVTGAHVTLSSFGTKETDHDGTVNYTDVANGVYTLTTKYQHQSQQTNIDVSGTASSLTYTVSVAKGNEKKQGSFWDFFAHIFAFMTIGLFSNKTH